MMLFNLSWNNIRMKPLSTIMTLILFGAGISIMVVMQLMSSQLDEQYKKNLADIDFVVGAKGSKLQLILSSIYHVDVPNGNISLRQTQYVKRSPHVRMTIPLAMGDNYQTYRIVGTEHSYPNMYKAKLQKGKLWKNDLEVTIGSEVAGRLKLKIGSKFSSTHGITKGFREHDDHHHQYKVVGIFKPTGTVVDQLILTNISSIWKIHDEEKPNQPQIDEKDREITALLVFCKGKRGRLFLPNQINENTSLVAAVPGLESDRLFGMISSGTDTINSIAYFIVLISGLSVFISLFNSLKERKYEIALMRVLGASRLRIFLVVIFEGIIISLMGSVLGLVLSHGGMELLAEYLQESYRYKFTGMVFLPEEWKILAGAMIIGVAAALVPALMAMKTNISATLAKA